MGRALPLENFRELAIQEEREPKMVEMLDRFEAERSDIILHNIQDSLRFMRLFGDVANLFFPVMMDTLLTGGTEELLSAEEEWEETDFLDEDDKEEEIDPKDNQPKTPDQGGDISGPPPGDGPSLN